LPERMLDPYFNSNGKGRFHDCGRSCGIAPCLFLSIECVYTTLHCAGVDRRVS
jgi:hypothetical protein